MGTPERRYFWTTHGFAPAIGAFQWSEDVKDVTVWRVPLLRPGAQGGGRGSGAAGSGRGVGGWVDVVPGEPLVRAGEAGVHYWARWFPGPGGMHRPHPLAQMHGGLGTGYDRAVEERDRILAAREAAEAAKAECGFCRFMRAGACAAQFDAWEHCVEAHRKSADFVEKCLAVTRNLKECMEAHPDYYEPVLDEPEEE